MATNDSTILEAIAKWTDYDRGWLSAAIDGEGHISLTKERRPHFTAGHTYISKVGISNTSLAFLEHARDLVGAGALNFNGSGCGNLVFRPRIVRLILPELVFIIKERQKEIVLEAIRICARRTGRGIGGRSAYEIERLEELWREMRMLNHRPVEDSYE